MTLPQLQKCRDRSSSRERHAIESTTVLDTSSPFVCVRRILVNTHPIVLGSAARTPIGGMLGDFSGLAAHELGAVAIRAAVERAGVTGDAVNEGTMGNRLMAV